MLVSKLTKFALIRSAFALMSILAAFPDARAQSADSVGADTRPELSVVAGIGNLFGGIGLSAEIRVSAKYSAVIGAGYHPSSEKGSGSFAFGVAARYYITSNKHGLFAELSLLPLEISYLHSKHGGLEVYHVDRKIYYGSGASVGYRYKSTKGFIFQIGGGVGLSFASGKFTGIGQTGVGSLLKL